MNQPKRKRRILRSLDLAEVSAVDRPAQEGAGAILRKNQGTNMNNHDEVVRDARAVRDDGAQPRYEVYEYECALLTLAREEQRLSEDGIAEALTRIAAGTNDDANARIFASGRKRDAEAAATVGKSAPSPTAADADAEWVSKSGAAPCYTRDRYEDEMLAMSKQLARPGEDTVSAFARLAGEGHFDDLYAAGERADAAEAEAEAAMAKAAPDDRFYPLLMDLASMRKRAGETIEAACARLLEEDPTVRDAYAAAQGM